MRLNTQGFLAILFASCGLVASMGLSPTFGSDIEKPPRVEVDGNIKWVYDYDEGKQLSQASGKPMFVVFRCER